MSFPEPRGWQAELRDRHVRLRDGARHLDFHLVWLRDAVGSTVAIDELRVDDNVLRIRWADGAASKFPIAWLVGQAYAIGRDDVPTPPQDSARLEVAGEGDPVTIASHALARVHAQGAAVIRRRSAAPAVETPVWTIALGVLGLRAASPIELASRAAIELPATPPGDDDAPYEVLHALGEHTELVLADAHAALDHLASLDADAARALRTTHVAPGARPHLPFDRVEAWFRARDRFAQLVRQHPTRIQLRAGDLAIVDRTRMLYGQPADAERAVRTIRFARAGAAELPDERCVVDELFDRTG